MAIVPLTRDVSMKTIREVINQKAVVLGQVKHRGTTYTRYGQDQSTGYIQVLLENISSSSITVSVQLTRNNSNFGSAQAFTLAAGARNTATFSGLIGKTGPFVKEHIINKPAASYTGNHDYDITITETSGTLARTDTANNINIANSGSNNRYEHTIALYQAYPLEKISMQNDAEDGVVDITSNYVLRTGVQAPLDIGISPAKLSDWRGAQVIHGNVVTRSSGKGRYGAEKHQGLINVYLDPNHFSGGPVTVTIPNVKTITKTISTNTVSRRFSFSELAGGKTYSVVIIDTLTKVASSRRYRIDSTNFGSSLKHKTYSFNGDTQILAYSF